MVRRRSGQSRSGDFKTQLVIEAQDLASRVFANVQTSLAGLGSSTEDLQQRLAALTSERQELEFSTNADAIRAEIDSLIEGLQQRRVTLEIDRADIQAKLSEVDADISLLAERKIRLEAENATEAEIQKVEARIQGLQARRLRLEVNAQGATAQLAEIDQELTRLGDERINVEVNARNAIARIREIDDELDRLNSNAQGFGDAFGRARNIGEGLFFIKGGIDAVIQALNVGRAAVAGFYNGFINSNVELQQQLLSTQATLAATQDIFRDGVRIEDPTEAILALEGPVRQSLENIRRDSLELVGVTSAELVPLFQTVAQGAGQIGASLTDAEGLTIDLAAALGTLNIPLEQARFEINSIFQGEITQDSDLAQRLQITNETIEQWRAQGTVVENLTERLAAFREGNALAARTIGGVTSNIAEIFQEVQRIAGEPLLEPIVEQLTRFYTFLEANRDNIQNILGQGVQFVIEVSERAIAVFDALLPSLQELGGELGRLASSGGEAAGGVLLSLVDAVASLAIALAPVIGLIADLVGLIADLASTGLGQTVIQLGLFVIAIQALIPLLPVVAGGLVTFAGGLAGVTAAALAAAPPLLALAAAIGAVTIAIQAQKLRDVNDALDSYANTVGSLGDEAIAVASEIKALNEEEERNGQLTEEQERRREALIQQSQQLQGAIAGTKQEIEGLATANGDQASSQQALVGDLNASERALVAFGGAAGDAAGDVDTAAKAVDQLRQNIQSATREIGNEEISINADQSGQLATLQEQLDQGLVNERDFQDERQRITQEGLDSQLRSVQSRVGELRAEYEALSEAEKENAQESLLQIQQLETQGNQLRQQIAESQFQDAQRLRERDRQDLENAQAEANATITAAATKREIELQELRNQGLLSERELNEELVQVSAERVADQLAQEQERLEGLRAIRSQIGDSESQEAIQAERQIAESEQRILELTKERLTTEQQLQQQAQDAIIRAIERRAEAAQNAATRESQALEGTLRLYDSLNAAIEQQASLLQAAAGLRQAENNLASTNLSIAANLTKNERERQRIQTQGAIAQLESLREQQAFEDQSLAIQQQLEQLALRRRQTEAEIAEIQARAAIASAEAERAKVQAAFERGDANELEVEAANLAVEAAQQGLEAAQQQRGLIDQEVALQPLQQEIVRRQQEIDQQAAENQARADVVASLPENSGVRRRLATQLKDEILSDLQIDTARSTRDTNALAERAVRGGETDVIGQGRVGAGFNAGDDLAGRVQQALENSPVLQSAEGLTPQIAGFDAAIAPLATIQTTGNDFLSQIAANTARPTNNSGVVIQELNVTVQGGNTAGQTGDAISQGARSALERILDQALAIQGA